MHDLLPAVSGFDCPNPNIDVYALPLEQCREFDDRGG
jgi:hypothetical protein